MQDLGGFISKMKYVIHYYVFQQYIITLKLIIIIVFWLPFKINCLYLQSEQVLFYRVRHVSTVAQRGQTKVQFQPFKNVCLTSSSQMRCIRFINLSPTNDQKDLSVIINSFLSTRNLKTALLKKKIPFYFGENSLSLCKAEQTSACIITN